jgi:thiol-disulfide isomerase/thioredoxin
MTNRRQWIVVLGVALLLGGGAAAATHVLRSELGAVSVGSPAPDFRAVTVDSTPRVRTLADYRGQVVLLNVWATWCGPCRKEMPTLDRLQAALGGPDFEVVAVNIDTRNLDKPKSWLKEAGIEKLAYYADPEAKVFQDLRRVGKAVGMPTTLLVDREGCELALINGPADWASEDALKLVRAALGR